MYISKAMDAKFLNFLILLVLFCVSGNREVNCTETNNVTVSEKQTFKEAEKEITKFINDQLRSLLPRFVGGAGSSSLSPKCMAAMMKILSNVRRLKGWSIKMLDSIGKPSAGILKGTSFSLGHYDQCIDLMITSKGDETHNKSEAMFQGMYCKVKIQFKEPIVEAAKDYYKGRINATELGKLKELLQAQTYVPMSSVFMSHYLGVCLPSSCSQEDICEIVQTITFPGLATVEECRVKSVEDVNGTQTAVMIIFLILICFVCFGTLIHWLCHNHVEDAMASHTDCRCVSVTVCVSVCNNTRHLMKYVEEDVDHTLANNCVRGIVVASVAWIILGQTYLFPHDAFYMQSSSLGNLQNYLKKEYFTFVVNYPLATDALFVCYGFILTYSLWYASCKAHSVTVNVFCLIIQNYIRIILPVIIFLGVVVLLPLIGSGPFWNHMMDDALSKCYRNAWAYVGMYSNFLGENDQCFPHLWFTSCLAQLTLAGIILTWILSRNMKLGITLIVLLALSSNIFVGMYTYNNELEPSYIAYFADNSSNMFWKVNYSLPLSHFAPYALGMLAGILVARRSRYPLRPFTAAVGWAVCVCIIVGLMLFIYKHHMESMGAFWSALYAGSHRTLFSVSVAWVILACSFGNGGFINAVLSWRVFDPLYRLSYYCYVFHFMIIAVAVGVAREHFYYSHLELVMKAISYIAVSYLVSYVACMILGMPMKSLCSTFRKKKSDKINVTSMNNDVHFYKEDILTPNGTISGSCKLWSVYNNTKNSY